MWSKSHATHKSVTRENFTIMLVVILILYIGTTVFSPTRNTCSCDLDSILYTLSRVRTLFVTRWFSRQINVFLFFNITFPLGHMQNAFRNSFPDSVVPNMKYVYNSTSRRAFPWNREYWWETSFWSSFCSKKLQFRRYQDTFASVSKKVIKKTFPTHWNDLWIRTKGYKTSHTAHGLRDFWITLYFEASLTCRKILRHGADGFTSPTKKVVLQILSPLKIYRPQPGLNPRILGWIESTITITTHRTAKRIFFQHDGVHLQFGRRVTAYLTQLYENTSIDVVMQ
jgi:hypothetical protein